MDELIGLPVLVGWPGGDWQATARLATILLGAYLLILWLATVLWAYRDTQARTREPAVQAIGVALVVVFPLLGVPLYLIVRPRETLAEAYERYLDREALFALVRGDESGERGAPSSLAPGPRGARPARTGGDARGRQQGPGQPPQRPPASDAPQQGAPPQQGTPPQQRIQPSRGERPSMQGQPAQGEQRRDGVEPYDPPRGPRAEGR